MKILYVEDNQVNVSLVRRVARMGGHEVINYIDGEDALRNFERDQPDVVLMDIQLAGALSGLEVVKKLREQGHKMPMVALTAYAMLGDRERCLEAGCDDYLAKPVAIHELVELFKRYAAQEPPAVIREGKADEAASTAEPAPLDTDATKPEINAAAVSEVEMPTEDREKTN